MSPPILTNRDADLVAELATYYDNPLGAILFGFPWGDSQLHGFSGPNKYQERFLEDLGGEIRARRFDGLHPVRPIRMSISSGHGCGKSALIGMLSWFLMSTRNHMRGTVTANTGDQLQTKSWAAIMEWQARAINRHHFSITSERFWALGKPEWKSTWFMHPQSCAPENSEAFAGQHAKTSTSVYMFDEASNVPEKIWEVAEGGLVWGEPMFFAFGNPTRRDGKFYQINFGGMRDFWNKGTLGVTRNTASPAGTRVWDAEASEVLTDTERENHAEWRAFYGEESDFYRVRVKGLPPMAGDSQFIAADIIAAAQKRQARYLPDEPLICGVDLSWGGNDATNIRFRRGMDARSIPRIAIPGSQTRDEGIVIAKLADVLSREWNGRKVDMMFIDAAGSCGVICRRLREMGYTNIVEVNFGGLSPDPKYKLFRSYMWGMLRDALPYMAIDATPDLEADLQGPGFKITGQSEILLELKQNIIKRIGHSTDDGDALALTWAHPVISKQVQEEKKRKRRAANGAGIVGAWT